MLLEWREDTQITLHTPIVVIADLIDDHPNQVLFAGITPAVVLFAL